MLYVMKLSTFSLYFTKLYVTYIELCNSVIVTEIRQNFLTVYISSYHFEVVCPGSIIWEDKNTSIKDLKVYWGADPVHLTPKGYEKMAEKLADRVAANQPKKRERSDSEPGNPRQKARMDTNRRLAGISRSDNVTKRWEKSGAHGGRDGHRIPPRSGNRNGPGTSRP